MTTRAQGWLDEAEDEAINRGYTHAGAEQAAAALAKVPGLE